MPDPDPDPAGGDPLERDRTATQSDQRRIRERSAVLLAIGLILLMPPVAGVFSIEEKIAGVPFTLVYLFAVWAGLIIAGARISRRLLDSAEGQPGDGEAH